MLTPFDLILALAVAIIAAALQGSVGFGFAVVGVPLFTLIDQRLTPVPVLLVALVLSILATWREREHLDFGGLGWIMLGRVPGALVGAWVLTNASGDALGIIIGLLVLVAVVAMTAGWELEMNRRNRVGAGLASGFSGTAAAIGGPPLALLYRSARGGAVRSNLGVIFTLGILVNLTVLGVAGAVEQADFRTAAILIPAALVGFGTSSVIQDRFDGEILRRSTLVMAGLSATILLARSFT